MLVTATGLLLAVALLATSHRLEKTAEALAQRNRDLEIARREAEAASRAKSAFIANMSHELRTPLNAIIGFSEILEGAIFGPMEPRYREYAGDILESGRHLLVVVNEILDLAKVETERLELAEEWTSLQEGAEQVVVMLKAKALKGGVTLEIVIPDVFPRLFADRTRLKQILLNLMSNAVTFTEPGGTVTLAAETTAEGALKFLSATPGSVWTTRKLRSLSPRFSRSRATWPAGTKALGSAYPWQRRWWSSTAEASC